MRGMCVPRVRTACTTVHTHAYPGQVHFERDGQGSITVLADGRWRQQASGELSALGGVTVRGATNLTASRLHGLATPHLAYRLSKLVGHGVGVVAARAPRGGRTLGAIISAVGAARTEDAARYAAYGPLAELKRLSQAAIMWNALSRAMLPGPSVQCARGWGRPWVAFMWDDVFGAMQLALDARLLAYSQLTTLLKGKVRPYWSPLERPCVRSGALCPPPQPLAHCVALISTVSSCSHRAPRAWLARRGLRAQHVDAQLDLV